MGFARTEDLGRYLVLLIFHERVGIKMFVFVVNKVRDKLNGYVASNLSLAGRLTLAKSVLMSTPNYFMTTIRLPILTCNEIEKLVRSFIWGSTTEGKKAALVNWNACCAPINVSGLGIRTLMDQNKVFLLKLGFQLLTRTDSLWVHIVYNKYNVYGILPSTIGRSNCSFIWRSLMRVWPEVTNNVFWTARDDCFVNFWNDNWVSKVGPLKAWHTGQLPLDDSLRVRDMVDEYGN